jgi:hypothetical protein
MDGELSLKFTLDRDYRYHKYRLANKNAFACGLLLPNLMVHDVFSLIWGNTMHFSYIDGRFI